MDMIMTTTTNRIIVLIPQLSFFKQHHFFSCNKPILRLDDFEL